MKLREVAYSRSGDTGEEGDVSNICDDAHKDAPRQVVIDR